MGLHIEHLTTEKVPLQQVPFSGFTAAFTKLLTTHVRASLVAQWLRICYQCRGHGFEPWSRKIPHATEQLSPCATTTEPAL